MANRNAKLIERVLKDFSLNIGSGGTEAINELPETGKEHTIYELHQNIEPSYNWVARVTDKMTDIAPSRSMLIFDTYEQMTNIIEHNNIFSYSAYYYAYLRNEDKLYDVELDSRSGQLKYRECNKISNYTFDVDGMEYIYVLKSYEGWDEATDKYYCTLYDGTKVELGNFDSIRHNAFILHQAIFECMFIFTNFASIIPSVTQLPTAQEAVNNYLDELIANGGYIFVEIDGVVKGSLESSETYYFDMELENFYTNDENPVIYTGPLEWKDVPSTVFTEIPYNDINELKNWLFKPTQAGEKVSYWIYTNDNWFNIDEIANYTANQIFVQTVGDYTDRPDKTITIVELDISGGEPRVISEVPYKIIDEEHMVFYNVPYNKNLYLCIDLSLVAVNNAQILSEDFDITIYATIDHKKYYNFGVENIGGSIKVDSPTY